MTAALVDATTLPILGALTVRQPWASSFFDATPYKNVENRSGRLVTVWPGGGLLAIHAGLSTARPGPGEWPEGVARPTDGPRGVWLGIVEVRCDMSADEIDRRRARQALHAMGLEHPSAVDDARDEFARTIATSPWRLPTGHAYLIGRRWKLPVPIPVDKGFLGVWRMGPAMTHVFETLIREVPPCA